jgi:hypothetical protein
MLALYDEFDTYWQNGGYKKISDIIFAEWHIFIVSNLCSREAQIEPPYSLSVSLNELLEYSWRMSMIHWTLCQLHVYTCTYNIFSMTSFWFSEPHDGYNNLFTTINRWPTTHASAQIPLPNFLCWPLQANKIYTLPIFSTVWQVLLFKSLDTSFWTSVYLT